jgi:hypothetical protein
MKIDLNKTFRAEPEYINPKHPGYHKKKGAGGGGPPEGPDFPFVASAGGAYFVASAGGAYFVATPST